MARTLPAGSRARGARRHVFVSLLIGAVGAGCAPPPRFADRAILWQERDDAPVPMPKKNEALSDYYGMRDATELPLYRGLSLDYGREAENVNALDETGDSTWYTDRRRVVDARGQLRHAPLPPAHVERGAPAASLAPAPPYLVVAAKGSGLNVGFVARDAAGQRWLFKFDHPGYVGLDTGTEAVVARLAWACGWNVPTEAVIELWPDELSLAPGAQAENQLKERIPFTPGAFAELVRRVPRLPDGRLRAIASRWLEGEVIGPFAYYGRRSDDPNDRIRHENRRDVRGFGIFAMWVNDTDTLQTNTLDVYQGPPGRGHLVHVHQDVGGSFGARATGPIPYWMGAETYFEPSRIFGSLVTLGIRPRPWEGDTRKRERARALAEWPEIGWYDVEHFDPRRWQPVLDNPAFVRQTARDRLWGMKRLLAVGDDELRAAVRAGRYRPEAEARLYAVLKGRRAKMANAFLSEIASLDYFRFASDRLCWDDLWVRAGLGAEAEYEARGDGVEGGDGACVRLRPREGYRVVELRARRPGERGAGPAVRVHFVERGGGRYLVGLER